MKNDLLILPLDFYNLGASQGGYTEQGACTCPSRIFKKVQGNFVGRLWFGQSAPLISRCTTKSNMLAPPLLGPAHVKMESVILFRF